MPPKKAGQHIRPEKETVTTIRQPSWLFDKIDALARYRGTNRNTMITTLLEAGIAAFEDKIESESLTLFSVSTLPAVTLLDRKREELVSVKLMLNETDPDNQLICEKHMLGTCPHVEFAKNIPEVQELLKRHKAKG